MAQGTVGNHAGQLGSQFFVTQQFSHWASPIQLGKFTTSTVKNQNDCAGYNLTLLSLYLRRAAT
jgi:hypothetical protein